MSKTYKVLIFGASYGSLLSTKLLQAGHTVHLVCLPQEAELINAKGTILRTQVKGQEGRVEISSKDLPGTLTASSPEQADPSQFDLVALAMQEPQYRAPAVRELLDKVGAANKPCMSIMNMPPLSYLKRLPGVDASQLEHCFTEPRVWDAISPERMTLCSPDPQAFRPPEEELNLLQLNLPTNFKAAAFENEADTAILRDLQRDIEAIRYQTADGPKEMPVKLKVYDSIFTPLAKWSMLMAGNYRCVQASGPRAIKEAVHSNLDETRAVYEWVNTLCQKLGADSADQVPFEKYARAAESLLKPSSAARALYGGAPNIERVDRLVQAIANQLGMQNDSVDETVRLVDAQLALNQKQAA